VDVDEREEVQRLLTALRGGDPAAVAEFFDRYGATIRAAVRRNLHSRLRTRFDSLDFVQDAWASFLALPADKCTFASRQALLGFLTRVAQNKVIEVFRQRFRTQKHNISRECAQPEEGSGQEFTDPTPSPSQWAIAGEQWAKILARVPPGHRVIVERLREGHNYEEIARMANVSVSTVNRIVRRLKDLTGL
jgi:RNA polymerase sigma factor (sigma-70 family)